VRYKGNKEMIEKHERLGKNPDGTTGKKNKPRIIQDIGPANPAEVLVF
jgi:hypothetical protein